MKPSKNRNSSEQQKQQQQHQNRIWITSDSFSSSWNWVFWYAYAGWRGTLYHSINQTSKYAREVSVFMCSGKDFQIWGSSALRLFVPYVLVFVFTTAKLFGRLADEERKQKRSCMYVGSKTFSVLKISNGVFDKVLVSLMVYLVLQEDYQRC